MVHKKGKGKNTVQESHRGLPHLRNGKKYIVWNHIHKERKLSHWILNFGSWESDANASKFKGHERKLELREEKSRERRKYQVLMVLLVLWVLRVLQVPQIFWVLSLVLCSFRSSGSLCLWT